SASTSPPESGPGPASTDDTDSTWRDPTSTEPLPFGDGATAASPLVINEVMASNDGAWVDTVGEADDWVELVNTMTGSVNLADFTLEDSKGERVTLPPIMLRGGQRIILWLDEELDQGSTHLPL